MHLITEARALAGDFRCGVLSHQWVCVGGRVCPRFETQGNCSQTVYLCEVCGEQDYGARGGPSHTECFVCCPHEYKFEETSNALREPHAGNETTETLK